MLGDDDKNSLLETAVFRPLYMRRFGYPKAASVSGLFYFHQFLLEVNFLHA